MLVKRWCYLNIIVRYPNKQDIASQDELKIRVAKFHSILMKEKMERLNIEDTIKKKVIEEVMEEIRTD